MTQQFQWPIRNTIEAYPEIGFDTEAAYDLKPLGEDDSSPLLSSSPIDIKGEKVGNLLLVVLGPNQIIGDETTAGMDLPEGYDGATGVLPHLGDDVIHLPVSAHRKEAMFCKFVNNLDLLRLSGEGMRTVGTLGHSRLHFLSIVENGWFAEVQEPEASFTDAPGANAIHNPHPRFTQVSGFFAINASLEPESISDLIAAPPSLAV